MRNKLSWLVGPGLVLLVACSGEQGAPSRSPVSSEAMDNGAAASSVTAFQEEDSCTLTQGFWRTHPEAWPVDALTIGGVIYTKEEVLEILSTPPRRGDATYILAHQLIAAMLSVLAGADDSAVATALADAHTWLAAHPLGSDPEGADREAGIALAEVLDQYNNGLIGPGHCQDGPPTPTPTPTPTPSPSPTPE